MKRILFLILSCLAAGCASIPEKTPAPLRVPQGVLSTETKLALYRAHAVNKTTSYLAVQIGESWYSPKPVEAYYRDSGADRSANLEAEGVQVWDRGTRFFGWSLGIGAVVGAASEAAYEGSLENRSSDSAGLFLGGGLGAGLGCLVGFIGEEIYNHRSQEKINQAADAFNASLRKRLDLDIIPVPGGAKAGASLRF